MDFARLCTLRELSLRKTMAAVAQALLISPSAVSQQIAQLEDEAGVQLVERRGRGVKLTLAGASLAGHAERIITVLAEARTDLAEFRRIIAGELRLSAFASVAVVLVPVVIRALESLHPRLQIIFEELEPANSLTALRAWQTDVALIDDLTLAGDQLESNLEMIEIAEDRLYAMLPLSHPLATKGSIKIGDLKSERWALDTASSTYSDVIVRACKAAGFEPVINGKCDSFEVVLAMIEAGCSISLLPGFRIRSLRNNVAIKRIVPAIRRRIFVAFRRGELRNPAIGALVSQLKESGAHLDRPA